jgi:hypothetical protein
MTSMVILSDAITTWTAVGSIASGFAALTASVALLYSMTSFSRSLRASHYSELDRMYSDLLRTALEHPHVNVPGADRTGDQKIEYEIYAFMVWNFLESIHDRCRHNKALRDTWYPVIDAENLLHREWFMRPDNEGKFKEPFRKFIQDQKGRFKQEE